jgi:hypothetical protein
MWLRGETQSATIFGFSKKGPTVSVPKSWKVSDPPKPGYRAKFVRDSPDGLPANCTFVFHINTEFHKLSLSEIAGKAHPEKIRPTVEAENERGFSAQLGEYEPLELHGLPGWRSEWSSKAELDGMVVPVRSRVVSLAFMKMLMQSFCAARAEDFDSLESEFKMIQESFTPRATSR